ncbi:MAG: FxLYD domain-containing protein, partial [Myxococcota bacterium]
DHIERKDAAASYTAADPLPLTWASRQPANIAIAVRLRDERLTESLAKQLHFLTLTVENTGARAIDLLRLRVSWFDSSGREVGSKLDFVALRSGPHLPPGETWAVRVIGEFPESAQEPFESFAVTVVEAE